MKRTPRSLVPFVSALTALAALSAAHAQITITSINPDGSHLFQPSATLSFVASSEVGVTNVTVQLTSTTLLGQSRLKSLTPGHGLSTNGPASALSVSASLGSNLVYSATIQARDANGQSANVTVSFDTIIPAYTFEAEDFDYTDTNSVTGKFIDNPQTNAYASLNSTDGADCHNTSGGANSYRPNPPGLATEGCGDKARVAYVGTGYQDYDVGWNSGGNWANYTRTFPSGTYNIYMRGANPNGQSAHSASLLGNSGGAYGTFSVPNTGGWQNYTWVPLKDGSGNLVEYSGGQVETLTLTTVDGNYNVNFYMLMPTNAIVTTAGPTITNVNPDGSYQFQQTNTLAFEVVSPAGVDPSGIQVVLAATNLLGFGSSQILAAGNGLSLTGTSNDWIVTTSLASNTVYTVVIQAADINDNSSSTALTFDTISADYYTFEAEDFDYTEGVTSALFFDNPQTNAYALLNSASGIDFFLNGSAVNFAYRGSSGTALNQENAGDKRRHQYDGGLSDFDLGNSNNGDWGNYTRTYPAGTYNIYLRAASGGSGGVSTLSLVTGGVGTPSQTLTTLGTFAIPATGGWQTYVWVPCKDNGGNLAQFTGGGVKTLRLTNGGGNNANYFMLVPADTSLPVISQLYPNGSSWFQYTNVLSFVASSSAGISQTGVVVTLDGTVVSGLVFSGSQTSWSVRCPLSINAAHNAIISVTALNGFNRTTTVVFDTFKASYYTWEAEDYDYGTGQFYDNPQVNSYANLNSTPDVDNHQSDFNPGRTFIYRPDSPAPSTTDAGDNGRPFGGTDYNIGFFGGGSWVNFTRHYPAGTYNLWGRFAEGASPSQLDLWQVTSGYGTTNQDLSAIGTFFVPLSGWSSWEWAPLKDSRGNLATLTLDGSRTTLRLAGSPIGGLPEVNVNFLMLTPSGNITLTAHHAGAATVVSFQTMTGYTYQVQYKNSLADTTWLSLGSPVAGDNTVHTVNDSASGNARFYRAQVSWQP